jgi:hypothetical chaperone protein
MAEVSCGIDFGTSNSSIAVFNKGKVALVPVEDSEVTIPSAIFFDRDGNIPHYGRAAIGLFFSRRQGRFMRSLKRVLGTSLMKNGTNVNGKPIKFERIITWFLRDLKLKADSFVGQEIQHVVMGRPVHFVDNDADADSRAEQELNAIAQAVGFKNISFQFEPIAAAFAHEKNVTGEKLAIVVDLGGGTSDFTVIRLSNQYLNKRDRSSDILSNTGVRVGGNDFDKKLCLAAIMPELGYRSTYGEKNLEVPLKLYHDLSEWSKVNFLYTPKILTQTRELFHQSHDKKRFKRMLTVLEQETGHTLLAVTEDSKIRLTNHPTVNAPFDFIEPDFSIVIKRDQFEQVIKPEIEKISVSAKECIQQAGIKNQDIEIVILTGGSTEIPLVQQEFRRLFPNAIISDENKLSSVGLGLAYDSYYQMI